MQTINCANKQVHIQVTYVCAQVFVYLTANMHNCLTVMRLLPDNHSHASTAIYASAYIYIYTHIALYMCVCICSCMHIAISIALNV